MQGQAESKTSLRKTFLFHIPTFVTVVTLLFYFLCWSVGGIKSWIFLMIFYITFWLYSYGTSFVSWRPTLWEPPIMSCHLNNNSDKLTLCYTLCYTLSPIFFLTGKACGWPGRPLPTGCGSSNFNFILHPKHRSQVNCPSFGSFCTRPRNYRALSCLGRDSNVALDFILDKTRWLSSPRGISQKATLSWLKCYIIII